MISHARREKKKDLQRDHRKRGPRYCRRARGEKSSEAEKEENQLGRREAFLTRKKEGEGVALERKKSLLLCHPVREETPNGVLAGGGSGDQATSIVFPKET